MKIREVKKAVKRGVAELTTVICLVSCLQGGTVTARAEQKELTADEIMEYLEELEKEDIEDGISASNNGTVQTYLRDYVKEVDFNYSYNCDKADYIQYEEAGSFVDFNTPGDYYNPGEALLVHINENKMISLFASDGVNKWPLEFSTKGTGWTTDGTNITVVNHPDKDKQSWRDKFEIKEGLSVDPVPDDIPVPPISKKLSASKDPGTFEYGGILNGIDANHSGLVIGRNTTSIGTDEQFDFSDNNLVIRSTRIEKISRKAFGEYNDFNDGNPLRIYLPKEKFKEYKSMLKKVKAFKKAKLKFYTLDKWNGKITSHVNFYGGSGCYLRGEDFDEVVRAERIEALKGTSIKPGSKAYKKLVDKLVGET